MKIRPRFLIWLGILGVAYVALYFGAYWGILFYTMPPDRNVTLSLSSACFNPKLRLPQETYLRSDRFNQTDLLLDQHWVRMLPFWDHNEDWASHAFSVLTSHPHQFASKDEKYDFLGRLGDVVDGIPTERLKRLAKEKSKYPELNYQGLIREELNNRTKFLDWSVKGLKAKLDQETVQLLTNLLALPHLNEHTVQTLLDKLLKADPESGVPLKIAAVLAQQKLSPYVTQQLADELGGEQGASAVVILSQQRLSPFFIRYLTDQLSNGDYGYNANIARVLGAQELPLDIIQELVDNLKPERSSFVVAQNSAIVLAKQSLSEDFIRQLVKSLLTADNSTASDVATALAPQKLNRATINCLETKLSDPNRETRSNVALAIARQKLSPKAIQTLLCKLSDPEYGVAASMAQALTEQTLNQNQIQQLLVSLSNPDSQARFRAGEVLLRQPLSAELISQLLFQYYDVRLAYVVQKAKTYREAKDKDEAKRQRIRNQMMTWANSTDPNLVQIGFVGLRKLQNADKGYPEEER